MEYYLCSVMHIGQMSGKKLEASIVTYRFKRIVSALENEKNHGYVASAFYRCL